MLLSGRINLVVEATVYRAMSENEDKYLLKFNQDNVSGPTSIHDTLKLPQKTRTPPLIGFYYLTLRCLDHLTIMAARD